MAKSDDTSSGFSRITGGLADLITLLVDLDKAGDLPHRGRREKNGVVVEYSVGRRTAAEGRREPPPAEPAQPRPAQRTAKRTGIEIVEPVTDIYDEANEMVLLFELPGVDLAGTNCTLDGDILSLDARSDTRHYRKEVLIEARLASDPPKLRLHNGVLEVRLKKQG